METLLLYFGKVILTSGVMFLYYHLSLKDRTFHHYNRFFLLGTMVVSLLLPLLKLSYFTVEVNSDIYLLLKTLTYSNEHKTLSHDFGYSTIITLIGGLVSVGLLLRFLLAIVRIAQLKKRYPKKTFEGIAFYQTDISEAPFSFFRNLFWKESLPISSDLGRQFLKHEMVHIEQKHSWDRVFSEILVALFWFNPIFHLIKREITLIHEYLADKKAITNSDTKVFAQMLLASRFSGKPLPATSPFLSSNLKKRLKMLKKPKTKYSYVRRIAALPVFFILCFFYLINAKNREIESTNAQIEAYVSTIKKDTILPPPPPPPAAEAAKTPEAPRAAVVVDVKAPKASQEIISINNSVKSVQVNGEDMKKIAGEMKLKAEALQKLSADQRFNSAEAQKLQRDLQDLGEKMKEFHESADFKNSLEEMRKSHLEMDRVHAEMEAYHNSAEFKNKIKAAEKRARAAEKMVNSPQFKKRIRQAEKRAKDAEKMMNSPEFKQRIHDSEKRAAETARIMNSPEFKERIKHMELSAQQAAEEAARKSGSTIKYDREGRKMYIFYDGKEITREEMDKIDPKDIKSMNVNTINGKDGKETEIRIEKKK